MAYGDKAMLVDANEHPIPQFYDVTSGNYLPLNNVKDVTLQNSATAIGTGTPFAVGAFRTVTVEITGTATGQTIVFEGSSTSGTFYPIQGTRLSDYTMATQTTGINEVWQFDVTGLVSFQARISAITSGNVNVVGKAVI